MPTQSVPFLVIHAPESKVGREDTKSFNDTVSTCIGKAYALNSKIYGQIFLGCRVVLLCKEKKLGAEGRLIRIEHATKNGRPWLTKNGIHRYDLHIDRFDMMPYESQALNRNGVAVVLSR
jgi:hypothetical protein